jgi:hypothetical protein
LGQSSAADGLRTTSKAGSVLIQQPTDRGCKFTHGVSSHPISADALDPAAAAFQRDNFFSEFSTHAKYVQKTVLSCEMLLRPLLHVSSCYFQMPLLTHCILQAFFSQPQQYEPQNYELQQHQQQQYMQHYQQLFVQQV